MLQRARRRDGRHAAAANAMLRQIAPAAPRRAEREAATIQKLIDARRQAGERALPCNPGLDCLFRQVRKAHYDFDEARSVRISSSSGAAGRRLLCRA